MNETMWDGARGDIWRHVESMVTNDVWVQTAIGMVGSLETIAKEGIVQNIALDIRSHMDSSTDQ